MLRNFPRADSPFFNGDDPDGQAFNRDGFLIVPDLLDAAEAKAIVEEVEPLYAVDTVDGPRSHYRVQDGWQESPAVKALASHPRILELLERLYGRRPFPFQTLNFRTGSQQRNHSDSIHFSSMPARFMCGVWVALEATDHENGPLFYVPGSHRLPILTMDDLGMTLESASYARYEDGISEAVSDAGLAHEEVHVPLGTAFVWSANLVHGGMPVIDPGRTRHSQVTHYFFDDCIYYTPFYSEVPTGELFVRAPIDIATGHAVAPSFNGHAVRFEPAREDLMRFRFETAADREADGMRARFAGYTAGLGADAEAAIDALLRVYSVRPDLQSVYGEPEALHFAGLVDWAVRHGLHGDGAATALREHASGLQRVADAVTSAKPRGRFRRSGRP